MKSILTALLAVTFLTTTNVVAQPTGHDAAAFRVAVDAWLDDDDQTALPTFANLARQDNRAAQVLLGRIATRPMGPWLAGMGRDDRKALLRAPGGLSGTSWLKVAAEAGDEWARMFVQAEDPRVGAEMVRALVDSGEDTAAGVLVARLAQKRIVDEGVKLFKMMHERETPKDANYLIGRMVPKNIEELTPGLTKIGRFSPVYDEILGFPFFMLIRVEGNRFDAALPEVRHARQIFNGFAPPLTDDEILAAGAETQQKHAPPRTLEPLWRACRKMCGGLWSAKNKCVMRSMNLVGGFEGLRRLGTPVEALIPHEEFANSKRAVADIGRAARLLMSAWPERGRQAHIAANACANDVLGLN